MNDFVWIGGRAGWPRANPPGNSDDMIMKFTMAGERVLEIGRRGHSTGNPDTENKTMMQIGVVGTRGAQAGDFDIVHHIAADSKGNLYTAEIVSNRRAQKLVPAATP